MDATETCLALVGLMRRKISNENIAAEAAALALAAAKELDRRKVSGEPSLAWERIYDEALWLQTAIEP